MYECIIDVKFYYSKHNNFYFVSLFLPLFLPTQNINSKLKQPTQHNLVTATSVSTTSK